ncbi:group III truncated hemoglobin [Chitinophaga sp. sic0106]|uniref:group III truncated hemoglobin n=1 Tax=Chitinophaga sp. sic0106 TaxID=2854785 RepID=UPI001C44F68C|nr:group III truncated hemoglobin [Chitinophaga sp. sic0106]MBV7531646.1 group III truncated hemoglobin [Chitinophaga sp. sic0106]
MEKHDIKTRADIELMVRSFYDKATKDDLIGYIFNDVMKVDWPKHLPVMYDFWDSLLLEGAYRGNAMQPHFAINKLVPLETPLFQRWLQIFESTVKELFAGETADLAITRARSISEIMNFKMNSINHPEQQKENIPLVNPGNQNG